MNIMSDKKTPLIRSAMNGGFITGGILVFSSIISYLLPKSALFQILFFIAILSLCIYTITKKYRDKELDGTISFQKSIGFGVLISFFASIIIAFIVYLELTFASPSVIDSLISSVRMQYEKMGISKSQIDATMQILTKLMSPLFMTIVVILFFTFLGFISSLFTSLIVQKEVITFDNKMKDNL
jgi:hypothetical protein